MSGTEHNPQNSQNQGSWQNDLQSQNQSWDRSEGEGQQGMQGNRFDPAFAGSGGQSAMPVQDRDPWDAPGQLHGTQGGYAGTGADFDPGNLPGGQGGYAGPGSNAVPGNLPGGQGGYAGRGAGGGGAGLGAMAGDPSGRFPERELGQNAASYGGGPGSAAAPAGGRTNRTGANTGEKLVGEFEKAAGKLTGNPGMVARGETRKMGQTGRWRRSETSSGKVDVHAADRPAMAGSNGVNKAQIKVV
ncbi:hypothetical protein L226DRAFT_578784 [Lentinus tigrinus ALCF2SS1-7]|uniref:uncharacterized protein n=1 Tax=Lentinus tigrinus ALCF2SS1-7 TaxID=1328758 RepID=UPI00116634A8|nr:hypothetical protein L226DRAFT_578784 [Lentinus tigrinus ALCF2SS1-7]